MAQKIGSIGIPNKLNKKKLVNGLSNLRFKKNEICDACQEGKQTRTSFKTKGIVSTTRPLELIHFDLFGPVSLLSLGGKTYCFVIVDDYSRFTWTLFLAHKDEAFEKFLVFCRRTQNIKGYFVKAMRSDHEREFENRQFQVYCEENGIEHNFLLLELHSIMEWWKERIGLFKKWLELCL